MVHESRDYNGRAFVPGRGPNSLGRMLPNQSSPIARHEASAKRVLPQTAEEIIETMRAEGCRRNLLDCREHFARLDKHNHGKITRRCFDAACTSLGFEWLTAADLDQLERQLTVAPGEHFRHFTWCCPCQHCSPLPLPPLLPLTASAPS